MVSNNGKNFLDSHSTGEYAGKFHKRPWTNHVKAVRRKHGRHKVVERPNDPMVQLILALRKKRK